MNTLDEFAKAALTGLLSSWEDNLDPKHYSLLAKEAYAIAEQMEIERINNQPDIPF